MQAYLLAPNAPENLTASEIGFNRILLRWHNSTNQTNEKIKAYKIYYSPPYPATRKLVDQNITRYELSGLFEVGVNYTFWVTALTKNLESLESNRVSVAIGPAAMITNLQGRDITNSSVLFEWESSPNRFVWTRMDGITRYLTLRNFVYFSEFPSGLLCIAAMITFHHL